MIDDSIDSNVSVNISRQSCAKTDFYRDPEEIDNLMNLWEDNEIEDNKGREKKPCDEAPKSFDISESVNESE
ncbi:hypothetical protein NPIL_164121 [Nephila pilipes]|uniref:Uncharacterized protein n=1 Tax=Nephila pilipes TaxID=299642 RepID=A0A8X6N121_NEPPI|nr:hypothetical protein NPIL_164121 [Nephila pilipes]